MNTAAEQSHGDRPPELDPAQDIRNPFFARVYHYVLGREGKKMTRLRSKLLEGLAGTVVEVGPGNGPNFPLYPDTVARVVAVEPEPYLREKASKAALSAPVPISVVAGTAEQLPLRDGEADAVLLTLVLCSVPDQQRALVEAARVLKPTGELRVFEHVGARQPVAQAALKAAEVTFWRRAFGDCHPTRHTLAAIEHAGFDTSTVRSFVMKAGPAEPPLPYIHGIATPRPRQ
jgi:ubiquinone/menaquinone biosynthesis C-methylase UbiE